MIPSKVYLKASLIVVFSIGLAHSSAEETRLKRLESQVRSLQKQIESISDRESGSLLPRDLSISPLHSPQKATLRSAGDSPPWEQFGWTMEEFLAWLNEYTFDEVDDACREGNFSIFVGRTNARYKVQGHLDRLSASTGQSIKLDDSGMANITYGGEDFTIQVPEFGQSFTLLATIVRVNDDSEFQSVQQEFLRQLEEQNYLCSQTLCIDSFIYDSTPGDLTYRMSDVVACGHSLFWFDHPNYWTFDDLLDTFVNEVKKQKELFAQAL